jgi:hypothetical protein
MSGGMFSDFVFDEGYVKNLVDSSVCYVPWCACDASQCFRLECLEDFGVGRSCAAPQLNSIGPNEGWMIMKPLLI